MGHGAGNLHLVNIVKPAVMLFYQINELHIKLFKNNFLQVSTDILPQLNKYPAAHPYTPSPPLLHLFPPIIHTLVDFNT